MNLQTKLTNAGQLYKSYATRLENLGITKIEDFLYHIPFRYEDFRTVTPISRLRAGEVVTVQADITDVKNETTRNFKKMQKIKINDGTGEIEILWFNQPFITKTLKKGTRLSLSGRVEWFGKGKTILSPEYEVINSSNPDEVTTLHTARLVPVYPETRGVSSKWLRRQVFNILKNYHPFIQDYLPNDTRNRYHYDDLYKTLRTIHFPDDLEQVKKARERLAFDELFLLQVTGMVRRRYWKKSYTGVSFHIEPHRKKIEQLWNSLPFQLTTSQMKALDDIFVDVAQTTPMNRLVQGDVGSGKTVVAAISMYVAYLNGFQAILMAPTEILAQQHFATISRLLEPVGVKVAQATGSKKEKLDDFDMMVGTHAVLSEKINYTRVGLVVIDEQQRFGVEQRAILRQKGTNPHLLTMTATPIPRTVALTMYGDLSLSFLNEMPKGRKTIKTWLVPQIKRENSYEWIRKQVKETASQIFIICPFIEESESMTTVKAALQEFEHLKREVFPDLKVGLLHGKLKPKEKDEVLQDFRNRVYDLLIATPVVEVGIDIPNATVIIIEAADRFGLAQLHQLRGRVGRGEKQSYCLLFTESTKPQTIERLKAMEKMSNGADLAELDLKLRGPGDMYGTVQSGIPELKIASFSDTVLIERAKKEAETIFPNIDQYPELLEKIQGKSSKQISRD